MKDLPFHKVEVGFKKFQEARLKKQTSHLEQVFHSDMHKCGHKLLHNVLFDVVFAVAIMFNLVLVIIETDAVAKNENPPLWADFVSWVILVAFCLELILRLFVLRCDFWLDGVNVFDFLLVVVDVCFNLLGLLFGKLFPVSFLRIVRLCKLARVAKAFHVFPELRLMMAGLMGSMKAIFWGTVLLVFTLVVWSIIAVQFIHPLNLELEDEGKYLDCERCSRHYSTVFNSFLTFSQQVVAGDNWGQVTITVIEHYPATAVFFGSVYLTVGMAVLNLILGVVVDVASQARDTMIEEINNDELISRNEVHSHLLELCKDMDQDGNGMITRQELNAEYQGNEAFREALNNLDIAEDDLDILWTTLDADKSGTVSYVEFLTSCYKLKSSNTHFMLIYIKYYITIIKDKILAGVKEEMTDEERKIEEEIKHEEQKIEEEIKNDDEKVLETLGVTDDGKRKVQIVEQTCSTDSEPPQIESKRVPPTQEGTLRSGLEELLQDARIRVLMDDIMDGIKKLYPNEKLASKGQSSQFDKLIQEKMEEKALFGPFAAQTETSNRRQLELLASLEEIRPEFNGCSGSSGAVAPRSYGHQRFGL